ncbi:Chaperonin CPN60-1 [Citrus sinensis]|nr:Chaperonin CPN60-1 [Citrus sinensis]
MTTRLVSENLRSRARMVGTNEEIAQVGTIAANGDKEIGDLIAKAIKEVGKDGPIMIFVLENPLILLHEKKLSDFNILMNLLAVATKGRKPVLIVADGVEDDVLSTLFARKLSDGMKFILNCALSYVIYSWWVSNLFTGLCHQSSEFGESRNAYMQELAFRTTGKVVTEKDYLKIKHPSIIFHPNHPFQSVLGHCYKVIVSKNETIVLGRRLSMQEIEEERSGQVGGSSKADVRRKKKIVTNALNAAKAAMDEGILPGGGGISLLHASKELDKLEITNSSQKIGVQIILNALKMPVHAIASSAGVAGSFVGKLLAQENHDRACDATTEGMHRVSGEYVDMINSGIVEPLKVISTAFLEAASLVLKELRISDRA